MNFKILIILLIFLMGIIYEVESAKILAIFVFPAKSHFMMTKAVIKGLLQRGHEVTFITSHSMESVSKNLNEILIDPPYNFWNDIQTNFNADNLFELTKLSTFDFFKMLEVLGIKTTEYALQNEEVKRLIDEPVAAKNKDAKNEKKFDLLIVEQFFQEAFLAFSIKYNVPTITIPTFGYANYLSQMMGVVTPYSFVPHHFLALDDHMNFKERLINTVVSMYDDFFREFIYFPQQDKLIKKYFSHLPITIPAVSKMEKNISLMLINAYAPLAAPRPEVPNMIPVGGLHIEKPKPLPRDLQDFLDQSRHGVIYFNLGTNVRSSDMPPEKLKIFLEVFSGLKQTVLWKWEDDKIPRLPKNIKVMKWMPQNDILAHPKVRVFITHGGLMGTQEGIYHGVPMLGIPVYCDQYLNLKKASKSGYAITLDYPTITKDDLKYALDELLHNHTYTENVKKFSQIFRDRPMDAMDTAMYWIDYIIRYNGAPQIQSAGRNIPKYQLYLLDVLGSIVGGICLMIALIVILLKRIFTRKDSKPKSEKSDKKKKN